MSDTTTLLTPRLLTTDQAAQAAGIHPVTLRRAIAAGRVEHTRVLSRNYFTEDQAKALIRTVPAKS